MKSRMGDSADKGASPSQLHLCSQCCTPWLVSGTMSQNQRRERKERLYRFVPFHLPSSIKTLSAELTPLCHSDPPGIPWDSQDQWWVWEHRPAPFCIPQSGPTGQLLDHNHLTALSWGHLWGPWSDREHIPSAKVTSPAKGSLHPVTSW